MVGLNCDHIYQNVNAEICPKCGKPTHEINWQKENELKEKWKEKNPNAKYEGWWSI